MITMYRDVICRVVGRGQGCPIISAKIITHHGEVAQAKGGRGGGTQNVTQNTITNPWEGQQPYLRDVFARAQAQSNQPKNFYPGQTYASLDPLTEEALGKTMERARAGSPVQRSANEELMKTLKGDYLYGGPGFDAAFNAARNKILPDVHSRFADKGRYGSGLAREAETKALADAFASQYGNERQNQLRAMFHAPAAAESDYADLARMAGVGATYEGQQQEAIDEAKQRHDFAQMEPEERLARFMNMIQGSYGGTTATQTPFFRNRGAGILQGALGGAGMGAQFGGPWGAGLGGILGGLTGLF